jgi:hypothetical protein
MTIKNQSGAATIAKLAFYPIQFSSAQLQGITS